MAAVEPLVDLFLELGITSPEAESLLRSLYVHKARDWLAAQNGGASPSDARVALVTGVHRNFVHQILSEPPAIAIARQRKGHRADKLLDAWHKQPSYLDNAGKPRDLPDCSNHSATQLPGATSCSSHPNKRCSGVWPSFTADARRRPQEVCSPPSSTTRNFQTGHVPVRAEGSARLPTALRSSMHSTR